METPRSLSSLYHYTSNSNRGTLNHHLLTISINNSRGSHNNIRVDSLNPPIRERISNSSLLPIKDLMGDTKSEEISKNPSLLNTDQIIRTNSVSSSSSSRISSPKGKRSNLRMDSSTKSSSKDLRSMNTMRSVMM